VILVICGFIGFSINFLGFILFVWNLSVYGIRILLGSVGLIISVGVKGCLCFGFSLFFRLFLGPIGLVIVSILLIFNSKSLFCLKSHQYLLFTIFCIAIKFPHRTTDSTLYYKLLIAFTSWTTKSYIWYVL